MAAMTGQSTVEVDGKTYRLHLGFIGLARLQERHGQDVFERLSPPDDAGENWAPPLAIIKDIVAESFRRFHADDIDADEYLIDEVLAQAPTLFADLLSAAFPETKAPDGGQGNGKRPKARAA